MTDGKSISKCRACESSPLVSHADSTTPRSSCSGRCSRRATRQTGCWACASAPPESWWPLLQASLPLSGTRGLSSSCQHKATSSQPALGPMPWHLFLMHTLQASCCSISESARPEHLAPQGCADVPVKIHNETSGMKCSHHADKAQRQTWVALMEGNLAQGAG